MSSEDQTKTLGCSAKVELYPPADARRDYTPSVAQLLSPCGTSVGREARLDIGQQGSVKLSKTLHGSKICHITNVSLSKLVDSHHLKIKETFTVFHNPQLQLSMCLECMDTGQTNRHSSLPVTPGDLPLSATHATRHHSQKTGPVNWSLDLRFYIHSSTGEFIMTSAGFKMVKWSQLI